ncbi:MAG: carbohydrate binding domain-containing protein, partial [Bacteroidaceae bacterium]|nr:carbohydrate binding domain-containing protein [Bacteroidaceae bacterium]
MHLKSLFGAFFMGLLCLAWQPLFASETVITVQTARKGAPIAPTMYGLFYEDINFAADGGMYAELVKNRSFEYTPNALSGWKVMGRAELMTDGPFERNPHYLRLQGMGHLEMWTGLQNEGFFGMGLRAGADYRFSVWARVPQGKPQMLKVQLVQPSTMAEHQQLAEVKVMVDSPEWKQYEAVIRSPREVEKAELRIFLADEKGSAWTGEMCDVEHISLFPVDTWRGHRNG